MRTFLLPEGFSPDTALTVGGERFHYLRRVLRLGEGDRLSGTDPQGTRFLLEIREVGPESLVLKAIDPETEPDSDSGHTAPSAPRIHLFQAVLKGKKMDSLIRQAVEAGVCRIVPVISEHAVPRYEGGREEKKHRRWETIVREAVQQSGSTTVTEVTEPIDFHRLPEYRREGRPGIFFHQEPLEQTSLHRYLSQYPKNVALAIGPEGGFSPREIEILRSSGFGPVFLKTNVLRAETAAIYAIGAVQTILTERAHWKTREEGNGSIS